MDIVKTALIVGAVAAFFIGAAVIVVSLNNLASRNLVLATATLISAMLFFVLQVPLELQRITSQDRISVELTIDRAVPSIRQWDYTNSDSQRVSAELAASTWLSQHNPDAFNHDRKKLTVDFVLFSLLSYFAREQFDWQMEKVTYAGHIQQVTAAERISKPAECRAYTPAAIGNLLMGAGNLFGAAPLGIVGGEICLPPRTILTIEPGALVVSNPMCSLRFNIQSANFESLMQPGTGGQTPLLAGGEAKFETRLLSLRVETTFFALRSQHRQMVRYRDWSTRVVRAAHDWFEK